MTPSELKRFEAKIEHDPSSCWLWVGCVLQTGYGQFRLGKMRPAHRVSYEHYRGEIPKGLTLDHLCRIRNCVNPWHLEPVTARENTMRSPVAPAALNARKTKCMRGHRLSPGDGGQYYERRGWRKCPVCWREYNRKYMRQWRARRKAAA